MMITSTHVGSMELTGVNGEPLAEIMIMKRPTAGDTCYSYSYKWVPFRNFFELPLSCEFVSPGAPRIDSASGILKWFARSAVWDSNYSKAPGLYSVSTTRPYTVMSITRSMSAKVIAELTHLPVSYVRDIYMDYFVVDTR
ncbi:MAG TPA: hypothetical protein VN861_14660 [Candidatus Acidoferrales bacterium]|nr:hypothetical protein [Candidatus Acidoferrales bacterium]